jgi:hypothetical protein
MASVLPEDSEALTAFSVSACSVEALGDLGRLVFYGAGNLRALRILSERKPLKILPRAGCSLPLGLGFA